MKPIYLEPDEEITSVIDKITGSPDQGIALVLAKNSGLFQSLVNLKLLAKEAKKQGKTVALITSNKVGARLAGQVGIKTYPNLGTAPSPPAITEAKPAAVPDEVIGGVPVKQYDPNRPASALEQDQDLETALERDDQLSPKETTAEPTSAGPTKKQQFEPTTIPAESLADKPQLPIKPADDLPAVVARSSGFSVDKEFKIPWKSVGIGTGILVFLLLLAFLFLPRAVVTVTFPAEPLSEKIAVSAVADLNEQKKNTVAGNQLIVKKTKTEKVTATGKKNIGTKATGTITVTNKYTDGSGAGKDQTFPAGTKATSSATGRVFTFNQSVTIGKVTYDTNNGQPIYKSQSVGVTAVSPGEDYNVAAGSFTIEGALSNTPASSAKAFSGGSTKEVTVLTQDDVDTVLLKLKKAAKEEAVKELGEKAQGQRILSDAIWEDIAEEGTDQEVGAETASATATLVVEYGSVVFDESAALAIFTATFDNRITADEEVVFPEGETPTFTTKKVSANKKQIDFEIAGTAFKVPKIDKTRIAKSINNTSKQAAAELLVSQYGAESVTAEISPGWWIDRLPVLSQAIRVEYGFSDAADKAPETGQEGQPAE